MKRWLAILLTLATVCAQTVAVAFPLPLPEHGQVCRCCGCGGMDCCVVPTMPGPSAPTPVASTSSVQKSAPATATAVYAVAWLLPDATPSQPGFSPPVVLPFTQSLHQRLCVLLI